ncbi:hypothetical protein I4U23_006237 [Adineta vaga]|nr:hypothetical protein I4U23_006237 [Adineta vaga]
MDEHTTFVEDIVSTKNTMIILHRVYTVNQTSLLQFASIFDIITEFIKIFTHTSAVQIETTIKSNGCESIFSTLRDTLDKLSDAITTKNTSTISNLHNQLRSCLEKFQQRSSYKDNNEETADSLFKKQLLQSHVHETPVHYSKEDQPGIEYEADEDYNDIESPSASCELPLPPPPPSKPNRPIIAAKPSSLPSVGSKQEKPADDPFSQFRFSSRPQRRDSSPEDVNSKRAPSIGISQSGKPIINKSRLMISYNHVSKPLCRDIYNSLTNDGYKVWIDLEEMHGSTLLAMAKAIEDSDIIIYCITEKYSESRNCQKEAEYAFVQQKPMIPLLLQPKYKPTGWLGLLLGADLYIDFTKNDFLENYQKLKSEIESNSIRMNKNKNDDENLTSNSNTNDKKPHNTTNDNPSLQSTQKNPKTSKENSRSCDLL